MDTSPLEAADSARQLFRLGSIFAVLALATATKSLAGVPLPEPARFWIARSNEPPTGPAAPTINGMNGSFVDLDIWAQPATVGSGPFSMSNSFKTMLGFSLNLVAGTGSASIIEFVDGSIDVHNPTVALKQRFAFWNDSSSDPEVLSEPTGINGAPDSGAPDGIENVHGHTGLIPANYNGIGGSGCNGDVLHCIVLPSGAPAWRVASVQMHIQSSGTANYHLQIGPIGTVHAGDLNESADTFVAFGTDAFGSDPGPTYNGNDDRNETDESTDTPDLVIHAFDALPGDFNGDGRVDAGDYVRWRNNLGDANEADINFRGDGGGVTVTDYTLWKQQYGEPGSRIGHGGLTLAVPEPASFCLWMLGFVLLRFVRCR